MRHCWFHWHTPRSLDQLERSEPSNRLLPRRRRLARRKKSDSSGQNAITGFCTCVFGGEYVFAPSRFLNRFNGLHGLAGFLHVNKMLTALYDGEQKLSDSR